MTKGTEITKLAEFEEGLKKFLKLEENYTNIS